MIPADVIHRIRSVTINHDLFIICGFSFFDKNGALLYKIGNTWSGENTETVLLEENEVIVGVVAKLYANYQSAYTDF